MRFLGSELKTKISKYSCWPQEWYLGSFTFVFSLFVLLTVFPSKSTNKPNKASTHDALNYIALNVHLWEHAVNHFKIYSNFFFFREGTRCFTTTWNSTRVIFFFFSFLCFDQQHILWWLISLVQEVSTLHRRQALGGTEERMWDVGKEYGRRGKTCCEKGNLPCAEAEWLEDISR